MSQRARFSIGWIAGYLLAAVLVTLMIYVLRAPSGSDGHDDILRERGKLVPAIVQERYISKIERSVSFKYRYHYRKRWFEAISQPVQLADSLSHSDLVGRTVLVLLDSVHPGNSKPLLTPEDFARYGRTMPDSLRRIHFEAPATK